MERFKIASHSVGKRLRDLRKEKGIKSADLLADLMGQKYSPSGILRREEGKLKIDSVYLEFFSQALKLSEKEKTELFAVARIDLWRSQRSMVEMVKEFHRLQAAATKINSYVVNFIPGQLQNYEYAKEVIKRYNTGETFEEEARIRVVESEKLLKDPAKRTRICFSELAMYFGVGSPAVMIGQLEHIKKTSNSQNLEVRVLPKGHFVNVPDQENILVFDDNFAFFEVRVGLVTAEDKSMVAELCANFETIWSNASSGDKRDHLIEQAIEYYKAVSA